MSQKLEAKNGTGPRDVSAECDARERATHFAIPIHFDGWPDFCRWGIPESMATHQITCYRYQINQSYYKLFKVSCRQYLLPFCRGAGSFCLLLSPSPISSPCDEFRTCDSHAILAIVSTFMVAFSVLPITTCDDEYFIRHVQHLHCRIDFVERFGCSVHLPAQPTFPMAIQWKRVFICAKKFCACIFLNGS